MGGRMKKISIVIPTYNEEANIVPMHEALSHCFNELLKAYDYEIIFIDNKSVDLTRPKIEEIVKRDDHVKAIFNIANFGQFNSPYYGLTQVQGDCAVLLCADFQDPIELIPSFIKYWESGSRVVCGIKASSKESGLIFVLRTFYYRLIKRFSNVDQIEHFTGFGLYDKSFIDVMKQLHDPSPFLRGIVAEYAPDRVEIPYEQNKRRAGKTKNNWYSLYDAAMLSFTSYTKVGLRLATFFGFFIATISIVIAFVYLILKIIFWNEFMAGTTPILLSSLVLGGILLFFVGLLGEYILNINIRVINRPLVIEEKRLGFDN